MTNPRTALLPTRRSPWTSPALWCLAGTATLGLLALPGRALAADPGTGENTPLSLDDTGGDPADVGSGGGSIARVLVGLLVVVGVIYGVTWMLKQLRGGRSAQAGGAIRTVSSTPLQNGSALHLVCVGDELLLVGSGANGPTELRRYHEDEARALGLWPEDDAPPGDDDGSAGGGGRGNAFSVLGRNVSWSAAGPVLRRGWTALVERLRALTVRG